MKPVRKVRPRSSLKKKKKIGCLRRYIDTSNFPTTSYCHTKELIFFLKTQTETKLIPIKKLMDLVLD